MTSLTTTSLSRRKFLTLCSASTVSSLASIHSVALATDGLSIEQYQGKVVLLDFWASWCIPCQKSFPWLNKIAKQYQDQGLTILGINVDEKKQDAEKFLQAIPAEFSIIYDPKGDYAKKYNVKAMPTSLLFDRKGHHITTHAGFLSKKIPYYEKELENLLKA